MAAKMAMIVLGTAMLSHFDDDGDLVIQGEDLESPVGGPPIPYFGYWPYHSKTHLAQAGALEPVVDAVGVPDSISIAQAGVVVDTSNAAALPDGRFKFGDALVRGESFQSANGVRVVVGVGDHAGLAGNGAGTYGLGLIGRDDGPEGLLVGIIGTDLSGQADARYGAFVDAPHAEMIFDLPTSIGTATRAVQLDIRPYMYNFGAGNAPAYQVEVSALDENGAVLVREDMSIPLTYAQGQDLLAMLDTCDPGIWVKGEAGDNTEVYTFETLEIQ